MRDARSRAPSWGKPSVRARARARALPLSSGACPRANDTPPLTLALTWDPLLSTDLESVTLH